MKNGEPKLHQTYITWFGVQCTGLRKLLFGALNGSRIDVVTGAILKRK